MARSLRILHCFRSPVGGIFRHVRDLVAAQAAAGHAIGIICDSTTGGELEERYFESIQGRLALGLHRIPIQRHIGPGDVATAWRTHALIARLQPDILHGHGAKGGVLARAFGSLLRVSRSRVARLYSPHGGVLHYDPATFAGRLLFRIERFQERLTDHILFVSDHERRAYLHKVGAPRVPSSLVYNGLQQDEFQPVETHADAADLVYIGMMRDLKGPDILLDAMALAEQTTGRRLTATMVGDGADLPRYREQAARLGLGERVRFLPPRRAREAFALGHVMVVPSRAEAMPYIVLEALAAQRRMIATAVGGIPEILGADSPALCMPEPQSLADRLRFALEDAPGHARSMPSAEELRSRFGAQAMALAVEAIYLRSLGGEPPAQDRPSPLAAGGKLPGRA